MYKNRINRTTPNHNPQFFIPRSEIAFDERVAYVESVCQVLVESRFGPGRVSPVVISFSDRPEPGAAVFFDLCDAEPEGLVPCYAISPLGRKGYQVVEAAYRRAKQMGLLDAAPNARNSTSALTPNQGRGSP